MENRYRDKVNIIIAAANFNRLFKSIYSEFVNRIYLKIKNKDPVHESLADIAAAGCVTKPTYFVGAEYYMRNELTIENVADLRDTIFCQLFPIIKNSSPETIELIIRSILEDLSNQIFHMDLVTFDDLKNISFRDTLLNSKPFMKEWRLQDASAQITLQALPLPQNQFQADYESYVENLINSRAGLWKIQNLHEKEYMREIESAFELSQIKLK